MRKVVIGVVSVVLLAGCGHSFKEGVKDGKSSGDKETRFENAARAKDTGGALDSYDKKQLVTFGNGVCLRLTTPKAGTSTNETADQIRSDGPADLRGKGWEAITDASVQELCGK